MTVRERSASLSTTRCPRRPRGHDAREGVEAKDGQATGVAEGPAKALPKYFQRGINRFDVAQRQASEVVMDVQM